MTGGSVVVRRSLGRRLKALRNDAGKTSADVTTAGIASKAKLARIEAGSGVVKMADVRALCWLYHADTATTDALADLALNTAGQGWWEDYGDIMPSWFGLYVELESAAQHISTYSPELVPGLLQTADYHRAVFETSPGHSPEIVERQVQLRLDRQKAAFGRRPPLTMTAVLSEGAVARNVGGPAVQSEQLAQLRAMSSRSGVEVRVLLNSAGAHPGMKGGFNVIDFKAADDPSVVYLETEAGARYFEQDKVVSDYRQRCGIIAAKSVPLEEYQP